MVTVGLLVRLEAKPGRETDVEQFLEGGLALVNQEPDTTAWFAIKMGPSTYGIFDVFPTDAGRQAHLQGRVAEALMAQAADLFREAPDIGPVDVLAAKLPA
ncbi:MAG TPA: antibiotic biosynthesis monooxygenase [Candidatus Limnocylindrales bacterium]|jgi:quinol monooxygenase YgiN|nr:antibiotic biosynthesis monooxygenase [Candidatus Limnocylindrales bacterium]